MNGLHVEALDINPLHWLGSAASAAAGDVWTAAMTGLWSAALWLLQLAFTIIDAFTTPDLSAHGPLGAVLPTTLWLGATLAVIMMFVQLTVALIRRDGQSIGRVLIGIGQFGLVWAGYLTVAAGLVTAAAGLEKGILEQMLHVSSLGQVHLTASWPTQVGDVTLATVLGILSLLVVIPAAFTYVLIMFVREAALIILIATAPISAGGLVSETGKVWFWKTLRWFFSCLLISPMAALVLGVGVKLSQGLIDPPTPPPGSASGAGAGGAGGGLSSVADVTSLANQSATAHAGMAVVGCLVIAIGACCPLVLFRLLAFVEPGTASGAALRQSWSDTDGMSGILGGGKQQAGSSAATQSGSDGRSAGESGAESQTGSRLASALGAFGAGMQVVTSIAHTTAGIGADVLGQAGVGAPSQGMSMTNGPGRGSGGSPTGSSTAGADSDATPDGGGSGSQTPPPEPPTPPTPPMPGGGLPGGAGGVPGGGVPGAGGAGAGGAGAAGGSEAAVAVAAL